MSKTLLIDRHEGVPYAALLENGTLKRYLTGGGKFGQISGNIYLARVQNVLPGMQAAFLDCGLKQNAFLSGKDDLPLNEHGEIRLKAGMEIPVQVTKLPGGDKGALVTTNIKLAGQMCVLLPYTDSIGVSKQIEDENERERLRVSAERIKPRDMGVILRTNAEHADEEELADDIGVLLKQWEDICQRITYAKAPALLWDESNIAFKAVRDLYDADVEAIVTGDAEAAQQLCNAFHNKKDLIRQHTGEISLYSLYGLKAQTEKACARKVWLKSGGFLVFDRTEAMTVIDVNTGKFTGKKQAEETIYDLNCEAAEEIVRQILLRDIGGIIIIDFIDMTDAEHKNRLTEQLRQMFRKERDQTNVVDLTPLGLVEMTRKKKNEEPVFTERKV